MLNKFVIPNENMELHLTPDGAEVYKKGISTGVINKEAADFFMSIDGTKTLNEIVEGLYFVKDQEDLENFLKFIEKAVSYGDIVLSERPVKVHLKVTGDINHYIPTHVMVELTYRCNLSCSHCYARYYRNNIELGPKKWVEKLRMMKELGVRYVEFTGGEPLIKNGFVKILFYCLQNFHKVGILTNGYSLKSEILKIIKDYKDKVLANISLDSSDPDEHNKFRGRSDAFQKTVATIRMLAEEDIFVRVTMSVYEHNIERIESTLILAKEAGAKSFAWGPVFLFGKGKEFDTMSIPTSAKFIEKTEELSKKYKDFVAVLEGDKLESIDYFGNCGLGWRSITLSPDGRVRACPFLRPSKDFVLGDIKRQLPLTVFQNKKIFLYRSLKAPDFEICGDCKYLVFCKGCVVRGLQMVKDKKVKCNWYRANEEILECLFT